MMQDTLDMIAGALLFVIALEVGIIIYFARVVMGVA